MPYANPADKITAQRARRAAMSDEERALARTMDTIRKQAMRGIKRPAGAREFVGVDGEGGGKDEHGRQLYLLLRAGDSLLFENNAPLSTIDCLGFLAALDPERLYVAYYFDYDVTMMLRDVPAWKRDKLCHRVEEYGKNIVYFDRFRIAYMPHKHFRVSERTGGTDKNPQWSKWVTVNDVGSFFQCAFYKALTDWQIGDPETLAKIKAGKEARRDFEIMTAEEIEYNRLECELLAELMGKFRNACVDAGYVPKQWQGPGYLASNMLSVHKIVKRKELDTLPPPLLEFANAAYYGGRSEITKIGRVTDVWECDINSAYPHAMLTLPCLEHGHWIEGEGNPHDALAVCNVHFMHRRHPQSAVSNLPIRNAKTGSIYWPVEGNGTYWTTELESAINAGTDILKWGKHWRYERQCDCTPFSWVEELYNYRKSLGKQQKGIAIKLAINSLYGKTAQSIGAAPYANPIWAGLITAHTRSKLIDAYAGMDRRNIIMLATDGLYTTEPPELDRGGALGQWEVTLREEMWFVQPGVYFIKGSQRPKTRGVPTIVLAQYEDEFKRVFNEWIARPQTELFPLDPAPEDFPFVSVKLHAFIGMKLANTWNKPFLAGKWVDNVRKISYDFTRKRRFAMIEGDCIHTYPKRGGSNVHSEPYRKDIGRWRKDQEEWNALRLSQPDYLEFNPHEGEDE